MKKLNEYLDGNQKVDYDSTIDKFMADPLVSNFIMNNDLTHETIIRGVNNIFTYMSDKDICAKCKGLYECKLVTEGFSPKLEIFHDDIELQYEKCRYNLSDGSKQNISAFYVPKKIFQAALDDFDMIGPERKEIHRYMLNFLKNYDKDNYVKGMYLSGVYGTGKTYILATMANELAKLGYKISFVYYPDLVRELKSSIGTDNFEEKIEALKATQVLFIDDIGGETANQFIRDEVLGPILQYRLLDQRPTFFSSNLKPKTLLDAMCKENTALEKTKAARIVERIMALTEQFCLTEKPHLS
ncbi:MAG: primosomal protein DnaI [Tenericutes bacterium]|nr:primosomal protein DnaI [Mycoplasmatota bacterium]